MAQHISVRIPWKDNGYNGLVCNKPCSNTCCLCLKNIAGEKNDSLEDSLKGQSILSHEEEIPCLAEGGCFMSETSFTKQVIHPYSKTSPTHKGFLPTNLMYPAFSYPARPFSWTMLKKKVGNVFIKNVELLKERFNIDYDPSREPDLGFDSNWVQDSVNQRAMFKTFYRNVEKNKSLIIPYAKQVPFVEKSGRVIMGIGFITDKVDPPDYNTNGGSVHSILWETMLQHSIRDSRENGFMMPYREMMEYAAEHPDFDIQTITVFAPNDYFDDFSFVTEHVSYDAVISVLQQIIKSLEIVKKCIPNKGNWNECIRWTKERLDEVWLERGPFPGLASMLQIMGVRYSELVAEEIKKSIQDNDEFEKEFYSILENLDQHLSSDLVKEVDLEVVRTILSLTDNRKNLFWLLARMALTSEQAESAFFKEKRPYAICDEDILNNPYLLYEESVNQKESIRVPLSKVDLAIFPPAIITNRLSASSALDSENDKRRIRAYIIWILEQQSLMGHSVYPQSLLIENINDLSNLPACHLNSDQFDSIKEFVLEKVVEQECADKTFAYQLRRLFDMNEVIRNSIQKRLDGKRHEFVEDWNSIVNTALGDEHSESEKIARQEKVAVLQELAASRLSVLIGGAGTGKTTLLSLLCKSPHVKNGGVLLLAPTGKARVRMQQAMKRQDVDAKALTVAQFLVRCGSFDWNTMTYHLPAREAQGVPQTVIVDECSMLTEEMFAALLFALKKSAQRLIFVGDPNQLPPIGTGRPFVDLVHHLDVGNSVFPKVGKGFGKLTITMRQHTDNGSLRADTELAKWYKSDSDDCDDEIFAQLQSGTCDSSLGFKRWSSADDLKQVVLETIAEETEMQNVDDVKNFNISIGGYVSNGWMNFGRYPEKVEAWQMLSAYRNREIVGSSSINRLVHEKYRSRERMDLGDCQIRGTRNILGSDGIVFGDKVINIRNQKIDGFPESEDNKYVANGEVGIVERLWERPRDVRNSHQIRFSSQPDCNYNWPSVVSEEGSSDLELAYALTVHKAQGSEFGKAFLVVESKSQMVSRELLYTAITRQKDKLVLMFNDDAYKLKDYSSMEFSEVARRFTCLFEKPNIVIYKNKFYEQNLIHKTLKGDLVRSKSEVIIADALYRAGIPYEYEKDLYLEGVGRKSPDFTIEDAESGNTFYWEHCGMLGEPGYRKRWLEKKEVYLQHGIEEGKNLIVSEDGLDGSIDSKKIDELIKKYFG